MSKKRKVIMRGWAVQESGHYWGYGYPAVPQVWRTMKDVKAQGFGKCWKPVRVVIVAYPS